MLLNVLEHIAASSRITEEILLEIETENNIIIHITYYLLIGHLVEIPSIWDLLKIRTKQRDVLERSF